jgi:hypothetical protein
MAHITRLKLRLMTLPDFFQGFVIGNQTFAECFIRHDAARQQPKINRRLFQKFFNAENRSVFAAKQKTLGKIFYPVFVPVFRNIRRKSNRFSANVSASFSA